MKTYRCAVLSVVKHSYVPRGVASHPQFQLVVVADDADRPAWVHERNQKFADEFQIPYIRDVERALKEFTPDVAVVSSEGERHALYTIRAAQAGLHVIQDKPMSNSLEECVKIVHAIEEAGVRFLMWNRNFLPAVLQARDLVASGAIGEPRAIHVDFYFAKDAGPPKGSRQPGHPPINWLDFQIAAHIDGSDGALGIHPMGELQNEGVYPLGYIRTILGLEVRQVFAQTATHFHQVNVDNQVEDLATVSLKLDRDVLGSISIGRIGAASHPDLGEIKIHVVGSDGGLVISEARPEVALYYRGQPEKEFRRRRVAIDADGLLMDDFADAIEQGRETALDVRAAWAISTAIHAALKSAQLGRPLLLR